MTEFSAERWAQAEALFGRALELAIEERPGFLERECSDVTMREEVASLLAHASGDGLAGVEEAIADAAAGLAEEANPDEQFIGARLGPYRLLSIAGHGGMGAVYRASREDGEFRQQVAIKLVRAAAESPEAQQRFRQERQILARLSHPNIARLLDGGSTPEGLPYLVMEYIAGEPITKWCEAHALSTKERLRIFLPVCDGVEAANRERIIHRDLKPANIFVTSEGVPKLLDFGISKMLDASEQDPGFTATRFQALTPEYAAPEQIRGEGVSPATEVYALGLVLYEVLTGEKAQRVTGRAPGEIEEAVCRAEPIALTAVNSKLGGDIETIVQMAIRKEPERRYASAAAMGEDIRRYLTGRPVAARPDTFAYRLNRFLFRNRVSLRAGVISAIFVIGALLLVYWLGKPAGMPRLIQILELTQNARINTNARIVTDGAKLYFTEQAEGRDSLAEIPVSGGTPSPIALPAALISPRILDIAPDGTHLLVAAGTESSYSQPLWIASKSGGPARRLGDAASWYAAWSRDGKNIFFLKGTGLYRINTEGTVEKKLADVPEGSYDLRAGPTDSPEILRFSVFKDDMLSSEIWEVTMAGTGLHTVLPGPKPGTGWPAAFYSGDWISSGRYYVLRSKQGGLTSFWTVREKGGVPSSGQQARIYSTPLAARSFTPGVDGRKIFFAAAQSRSDLARYDTKRKQFLPFLRSLAADYLDESRDERQIAYTVSTQYTLWKSSRNGGERVQLTFAGMRAFRPRWSPDGKNIAFTGSQGGEPSRAYVIPSAGGTARLAGSGPSESSPSWSPDGASLLITRTIPKGQTGTPGLYRIDWQTHREDFVRGSEALRAAEWSPDARYIAAIHESSEIQLLDVKTGRWSVLAHGSGISALFWSADGQYVLFQDAAGVTGQPLMRVRVKDRKVEQVVSSGNIPQSDVNAYVVVGLAHDDAPIALILRSNSDIYALDLDLP